MSRFFALTVLLAGCGKPPAEAPAELNDLLLFLTTHFDDTDPAELDAGLVKMNDLLGGYDLQGDISDRAFTVAALDEGSLGGMPAHAGYSAAEQIPVGVATLSVHDLESQLKTVAETNQVCIESATTKYYSRTFDTDLDCFMDHSCDRVLTSNEVRKESPLGNVWYDLKKDYRWMTLENGDDVMIARTWAPDAYPTDGGGGSFDQTYILDVFYPDGTNTRRFIAMWSSVTLSFVGDDAWAGLVRGGIDEAGAYHDDYIAGFAEGLCSQDRDRAYDRPQ